MIFPCGNSCIWYGKILNTFSAFNLTCALSVTEIGGGGGSKQKREKASPVRVQSHQGLLVWTLV